MKKIITLFFLLSSLMFANPNSDAVLGYWVGDSQEGNHQSVVKIEKTKNNSYTGIIVKLINPKYIYDIRNQNPNLRSRKLVGIKLLYGFSFIESDQEYKYGRIYNPEDGRTYYAKLWVNDNGTLSVRGSIDPLGWFGLTVIWNRPSQAIINSIEKTEK